MRWLLVAVLAALIALVALVRPLPEPSPPTPTAVGGADVSSTPTYVPSPTLVPTLPPSPTPEPTATPTLAPSPAPTPAPTELPDTTPSPTSGPSPSPTATSAPLAGRVERGTYPSTVTGRTESYRIYLPPGYHQADRRYPALYLLHGWPYDETHWDNLGVDEVADAGIVAGTLSPFIIVLPGADSDGLYVTTSGGAGSFEEQLVNELMPHVDATFRTVQTRDARAIGGISRGGVWALEIALRHPDAFAIVGAHSPALSANRAPPAYDPFTLMNQPGVESLRIYLSAGDRDWAREATRQLHQALNTQGISNQFVVHSGAHVDQLWANHIVEYLAFYAAGW
jgi:enterochelin esterase-like enzyme